MRNEIQIVRNEIQIVMDGLNTALDEAVVKAVAEVGINVNKDELIKSLRARDFVDELLDYLFITCKDDDYITPEAICRKLCKYDFVLRTSDGTYVPMPSQAKHSL